MNIYFDNAATTRVRDEVISEISNILNWLSVSEQKETEQISFLSLYKADINKIIEKWKKTLPKPTTMNTQIKGQDGYSQTFNEKHEDELKKMKEFLWIYKG